MSEKKRTSISLPKETYEWLSESALENSALITELLEEYRESRESRIATLEMQLKHARTERDDLQQQLKHAEEKVTDLEEQLAEARDAEDDALAEAKDALSDQPSRKLTTDNPAVKNWAEKVGVTPAELLARLS